MSASGIDLATLRASLTSQVVLRETELSTLFATADFDNTGVVLNMQQQMSEYSYLIGLSSATIKVMIDALKSIVQRLN